MKLEVMKEKLEKLESKYDNDFENEESMPNDLLDQAERIMVYHRKIIKEQECQIKSLQSQTREYIALLEECKKEAVFDYNYTLADKIIAATGKENEITPNNYKLTKQERFALNVLLAGASEDGFKNNETIFRDYHAGTLYQLIMLKLFKPGNFTEKKRKEEINRLTVECKIIGKAVE